MRKIRLDAGQERDRLRQEGARLERTILDKVRKETQKTLQEAEEKLGTERRRIRGEIDTSVPALSRDIATRILGREVG